MQGLLDSLRKDLDFVAGQISEAKERRRETDRRIYRLKASYAKILKAVTVVEDEMK